jgi:hypothetical protein
VYNVQCKETITEKKRKEKKRKEKKKKRHSVPVEGVIRGSVWGPGWSRLYYQPGLEVQIIPG